MQFPVIGSKLQNGTTSSDSSQTAISIPNTSNGIVTCSPFSSLYDVSITKCNAPNDEGKEATSSTFFPSNSFPNFCLVGVHVYEF